MCAGQEYNCGGGATSREVLRRVGKTGVFVGGGGRRRPLKGRVRCYGIKIFRECFPVLRVWEGGVSKTTILLFFFPYFLRRTSPAQRDEQLFWARRGDNSFLPLHFFSTTLDFHEFLIK